MVITPRTYLPIYLAGALMAGLLMPAGGTLLAQSAPTEYQVKAAFLYNFAKFVEWPAEASLNADKTFVIGVLGEDPFGQELEETLNGKTIQEKTLVFKPLANLKDAGSCRVIFISASEKNRLPDILDKLHTVPVLTVSDIHQFIQSGGIVGFTLEDSKVRFGVNLTAAERARLKISSQLLKLATTVKGNSAGGFSP